MSHNNRFSNSLKESQFTTVSDFVTGDLITGLKGGTNVNFPFSALFDAMSGLTNLNSVGAPLGAPVLEQPGAGVNNFRNLEDGAGVSFSVSAQNGIVGKWNVAQDSVGFPLTSGLTALQPVITSLIAGTGIGIAQGTNSLTLSATGETTPTNTVVINQESDFPIQTATTITLSEKTRYVIGSAISSAKRFICEDGFVFTMENIFGPTYTYTGSGDMFSSTLAGGTVIEASIDAPNASQLFNMSDTSKTKIFVCNGVRVQNTPKWGTYTGFTSTQIKTCSSLNSDDGLTISGTGLLLTSIDEFAIISSDNTCVQLDLGSSTVSNIELNNLILVAPFGGIQVKGAAGNANVPAGLLAMLSNSSVLGGATQQLSGITGNDFRWGFTGNNETADTRPDGLASIITNATETVIAASSTDGTNAVKMAGTWVIEGSSHFTVDTTGRITYNGERDFTAPLDVTANVLMASGSTKNVSAYLNVNGTIERATEGPSTPTSSLKGSCICHWQHTFTTGQWMEVWLENQSDAINIIGQSGVLRVN